MRDDRENGIGSLKCASIRDDDDAVGGSRCVHRMSDLCALALRFCGCESDHTQRGAAIAFYQETSESEAEVAALVEEDDGLSLRRGCSSVVVEA